MRLRTRLLILMQSTAERDNLMRLCGLRVSYTWPLVDFQYDPEGLDLNKKCFDEKPNITNVHKESVMCIKTLLNSLDVVNVSPHEVEAVEYFRLLGMKKYQICEIYLDSLLLLYTKLRATDVY